MCLNQPSGHSCIRLYANTDTCSTSPVLFDFQWETIPLVLQTTVCVHGQSPAINSTAQHTSKHYQVYWYVPFATKQTCFDVTLPTKQIHRAKTGRQKKAAWSMWISPSHSCTMRRGLQTLSNRFVWSPEHTARQHSKMTDYSGISPLTPLPAPHPSSDRIISRGSLQQWKRKSAPHNGLFSNVFLSYLSASQQPQKPWIACLGPASTQKVLMLLWWASCYHQLHLLCERAVCLWNAPVCLSATVFGMKMHRRAGNTVECGIVAFL